MNELIDVLQHILYLQNFNQNLSSDMINRFIELYLKFNGKIDEKYANDALIIYQKYRTI